MHKVLCLNKERSRNVCLVLENQREMWYNNVIYKYTFVLTSTVTNTVYTKGA